MAKYESLKKASVARAKESGIQITTTQDRTRLLQTEGFLSFVTERAHLWGTARNLFTNSVNAALVNKSIVFGQGP